MGRSRSRSPGRRKRSRSRSRSRERRRSRSREPKRERRDSPGERRRDDGRRWSPERRGGGERERGRDYGGHGGPPPLPPPPLPPPPPGAPGGANGGKRAEPLSLEELLKKRAADSAAAAKPVFLSKAQREALAAKEKADEEEAARRKASEVSDHSSREWARQARQAEERRRDEERRKRDAEREHEKQMELIKLQYLGAPKEKKKVMKPADKFKFMFDWEPEADTSRDLNPLYASRHEAALQFGRGLRAGVDRVEAKTAAAAAETATLARQRLGEDGRPQPPPSREEAAAAAEERRRALAVSLAAEERYDRAKAAPQIVHWSTKALTEMNDRDWRIFREDHSIATKGGKVPNPFRSWAEAPLPEPILRAVEKVGYVKPSPIQMAAIPIGVAQRDVIGIAETGSGKTCAFVLPMLAYIMRLPVMKGNEAVEALGPYAVVLSPTRELAQQTEEECGKFAQYLEYRVVSVVGGQDIEAQGFKLRQGCEIMIGTPGRIIDCLERRYTVLHQCNFVVLDEADRMIDYGFEPQVIGVMDAMPSSNLKPANEEEELEADKVYRTTFMFSATMPSVVERLARKYLRNPAVVTIGSAGKAADLIRQDVIMLRNDDKPAALEAALRAAGDTQVIVFVNTHKTCDYIGKQMERLGKPTCVLHGGKTQDAREFSIDGFRQKRYQVLIATDVAGRGIDVPDVGLVVNYQMPSTIEAYTHRIGRTGRAGKKGVATSFVTPEDRDVYFDLKQLLTESGNVVPPELARHEASKKKPQKGPDYGRDIDR